MRPAFYEVQRFRQTWIMLLVLAVSGMQWVAAVEQLLLGKPFGQNPSPDSMIIVFWIIFGIGLPILFYSSRLVTEIRENSVYFRFFPFHRASKRIDFTDVKRCELRTFNAILEYRGWGIRWQHKGKAYIVNGDCGVQFELKNGKRYLIGSQKVEEFWQAIPAHIRAPSDNFD